jgi:uncharacterized protein involved in exopolysaccharide biosynthesis
MEQIPRSTYQNDEISLVDLAKILIHRRWWFFGTSGLIVTLALVGALIVNGDPEYQYTSIYQQAETEPGESITSSASVIQQLQSLDWPNFQRRYKEENNVDELPFGLEITNPANTTLITLNSAAMEENRGEVVNLHETLLESASERQQTALERRQAQLERSIERVSAMLERVENTDTDASVEMAASYSDQLFELESELENLTDGEVIEYAAQGEELKSSPIILIIALGIVLGGVAGVIAAFFAEFAFRVRQSIQKEKNEYN